MLYKKVGDCSQEKLTPELDFQKKNNNNKIGRK
jgi:hypothetical protein